jgi:hypothetical protein
MSGYPQSWDQPFTTPFDQGHSRAAQAGHPAYGQPQGYAPQGYPQQPPQGYAPQGYGAPGQEAGYDWGGFDPAEYEEVLVPEGTHVFQFTDSQMKRTKKGGLMLSLRLEVQAGFSTFVNLNIENENKSTEQYAKADLVKILKCVGLPDMRGGIKSLIGKSGTVVITHKEDSQGTVREKFAWKPAQAQAPMGAPVPQPMAQPMPQMPQVAPAPQWQQPAPQPMQQPVQQVPQPQPAQSPQPVPGMSTAPGLPQDGTGMMRPIEQLPSQQLPPLDPQFAQPRPNPFQQR